MATKKTLNEQIESAQIEIRQRENRLKELMQKQKEQERKDRTRRLCERGGYLESILPESVSLTAAQFKTFLDKTTLTAERFLLCEEYYRLKDETHSVELLRKGAENIMRESGRDMPANTKKREAEL